MTEGPEWLRTRRRTIITTKYVLAVLLSLHVTAWLGVIDFLSASFVAVATLQPNLYRGLRWSWDQLLATTLGAGVSAVVLLGSGGDLLDYWWMFQAAAAMGITIFLCLRFNLGKGTTIAIFTVVYLACLPRMIPDQGFWDMFHIRYATILIGLATATLLNYGSSLFRYRDRLALNLRSILQKLVSGLESLSSAELSHPPEERELEPSLDRLRDLFESIHDMERDLAQLDREAHWTVSILELDEIREVRARLLLIKNLVHHTWTLLLKLLHHPPESDVNRELQQALSDRTTAVERMVTYIEGGKPEGETLRPDRWSRPDEFEEEFRLLDENIRHLIERREDR